MDTIARMRLLLAKSRQALEEAEATLDAASMVVPSPQSNRYVPPVRRQGDVWVALVDAPDEISTSRLAQYWGCHPNAVLYYINRQRLVARKDKRRLLVSKASALALDAAMRAYRGRTPPAA